MSTVYSIKLKKGYAGAVYFWLIILIGWTMIQTISMQDNITATLENRKVELNQARVKYLSQNGIKDTMNQKLILSALSSKKLDKKYNKFRKIIRYHSKDSFTIYSDKAVVSGVKIANINGAGVIEYDK